MGSRASLLLEVTANITFHNLAIRTFKNNNFLIIPTTPTNNSIV
jgi:hypothetical protein